MKLQKHRDNNPNGLCAGVGDRRTMRMTAAAISTPLTERLGCRYPIISAGWAGRRLSNWRPPSPRRAGSVSSAWCGIAGPDRPGKSPRSGGAQIGRFGVNLIPFATDPQAAGRGTGRLFRGGRPRHVLLLGCLSGDRRRAKGRMPGVLSGGHGRGCHSGTIPRGGCGDRPGRQGGRPCAMGACRSRSCCRRWSPN